MYQRDVLGQDWFTDPLPDFGPSSIVEVDTYSTPDWSYTTVPDETPGWSFYDDPVSYPSYEVPQLPAPAPLIWSPEPSPVLAPVPQDSSWSWESIWKGIEPVIRTGAEAFTKIYPVVTGTKTSSGQAQAPTTTPRPGALWPANTPPPSGYRRDPMTGKLVPTTMQAGITASPYFWPVALGLGAMVLMSSGGSSKRRR